MKSLLIITFSFLFSAPVAADDLVCKLVSGKLQESAAITLDSEVHGYGEPAFSGKVHDLRFKLSAKNCTSSLCEATASIHSDKAGGYVDSFVIGFQRDHAIEVFHKDVATKQDHKDYQFHCSYYK